ncbi:MAG: glutathione S-transferase family protein [Myxococcota bacterium]
MTNLLTLYHNPGSRSERVRKLLEITELHHELVRVSPEDLKSSRYLEINPLGVVPTLTHGSHTILESAAQMMYLADLVPEKGLAPPIGTPDRGCYYSLFCLSASTLEPRVAAGLRNPKDPVLRADMLEALGVLVERIEGPYCLGSEFTAVDVLVHWQLSFCAREGHLQGLPKGLSYVEALASRLEWASSSS